MSETAEFWRGEFGNAYTGRNRVEWEARIPFWQRIIGRTHAKSVFEVGCNAGWNLRAIHSAAPNVDLFGCDVNDNALEEARSSLPTSASLFNCQAADLRGMGNFDLVFSAGVLIHISPDDLSAVMDEIIRASNQYVLAVEYADETEVEVSYRGYDGKLWRRPFGRLYQEKGLRIISSGDAPAEAFDRCEFWLMEVPA